MSLTAAQITALAADIATNTATAPGTSGQISALAHTADNAFAVAAWYNLFPATDFFGNYASVPMSAIKSAIKFKNYTPTDAVPASGSTTQITNDLLNHVGRSLFAQTFQLSLNNLFITGTSFDATNANLVSALKDATNSNMPTGASGANQTGGWSGATGVQTVLCRKGTNAEKLLATITAGTGTGADNTHAAVFTFEGQVNVADIEGIWGI